MSQSVVHVTNGLDDFGFPPPPTFGRSIEYADAVNDITNEDLVKSPPSPDDNFPKCKGDTSSLPEMYVYCGHCFRYRQVIPSCGQRNCPRCQGKRSRLTIEKYLPALLQIKIGRGRRWIAVTLTGYRIPKDAVGVNVEIFSKIARTYLKRKFLGGDIAIEHTKKPDGYYIHAHALCLGDFQNQVEFEYGWGSHLLNEGVITEDEFRSAKDERVKEKPGKGYEKVPGVRYCWLSDMRHNKENNRERTNEAAVAAGLKYLLKYVSKGVALDDDELDQVKGLRYISSFGELYNMRLPVFKSRCTFCDGPIALGTNKDIDIIEERGLAKGSEPLELKRVISWPVKAAKATKQERLDTQNSLKEWWRERWRDLACIFGVPLLVNWLLDRNNDHTPIVIPS